MFSTVADLKSGQRGVIREIQQHMLPIKLLELGCLPGSEVELVQVAPLSDPLYINVNGSHIAIRRETARIIEIDLIEASASDD